MIPSSKYLTCSCQYSYNLGNNSLHVPTVSICFCQYSTHRATVYMPDFLFVHSLSFVSYQKSLTIPAVVFKSSQEIMEAIPSKKDKKINNVFFCKNSFKWSFVTIRVWRYQLIRIRKSQEKQHNGQKKKDKRTNNDLQKHYREN